MADTVAFDFHAPDGSLAGFVAMAFDPGVVRFRAGLVGDGRPYVLVRDPEVTPPRRAGTCEVRAEGLWADLVCEAPDEHWSMGMEAFGVALDDPDEALRGERGDRVGLGFDLEWEAADVPFGGAQPGAVHGEVLVGAERLAFDGLGWRGHHAGFAGWTDDGVPVRVPEDDVGVEATRLVTLHPAPTVELDQRLARLDDALGWFRRARR